MADPTHGSRTFVELGPFRLDLETGELWREGCPVDLPPLPSRALLLLAERPDRLVGREELRRHLWGEAHLDWEKSLYFCILQIRRALGETSEAPRYVETVPRRGYRLNGATRVARGRGSSRRQRSRVRRLAAAAAALGVALLALVVAGTMLDGAPRRGDGEALRLAREARYLLGRTSLDALIRARGRFEEAVARDPGLAGAWSGLALARLQLHLAAGEPAAPARAAAERALELDPRLAEAHRVLGDLASVVDWDHQRSRREYEAALRLDPGELDARVHYASHFLIVGEPEEAVRQIEIALAGHPASALLDGDAAWTFLYAGRPRRAEALARRALELEPGRAHVREALIQALAAQGRGEEAEREARSFVRFVPGAANGGGEAAAGESGLDELHRALLVRSGAGPNAPVYRALHQASLGEIEAALASLEAAYERRAPLLILRMRDPRLAPLHAEPRFRSIVEALRLPWTRVHSTASAVG